MSELQKASSLCLQAFVMPYHQVEQQENDDYCCFTDSGWSPYKLDPASGPEKVFSKFFGTSNPYEALNGKTLFLNKSICCFCSS